MEEIEIATVSALVVMLALHIVESVYIMKLIKGNDKNTESTKECLEINEGICEVVIRMLKNMLKMNGRISAIDARADIHDADIKDLYDKYDGNPSFGYLVVEEVEDKPCRKDEQAPKKEHKGKRKDAKKD